MPYPKKTEENIEQVAKWFYAKCQFAASSVAAFGTPSLTFCCILAIEVASFLMTLVRKGMIEAETYHKVYAMALFLMFPALVCTLHSGDELTMMAAFRSMVTCFISCELRMSFRVSKYITWFAAVIGALLFAEAIAKLIDVRWVAWPAMLWSIADTLIIFFKARKNDRLFQTRYSQEVPTKTACESEGATPEFGG